MPEALVSSAAFSIDISAGVSSMLPAHRGRVTNVIEGDHCVLSSLKQPLFVGIRARESPLDLAEQVTFKSPFSHGSTVKGEALPLTDLGECPGDYVLARSYVASNEYRGRA